ncbi:hypothetical protein CTI12_AA464490 [Artemisia annua]|uniref:Uncharacterized protein n=1 Tax=Artemisia annua TaxID=35608 RepID=A0A2U1LQE9_ARTAN|nr:hypothetical protein CTI12_AA464490 [Artemisia annua]
MASQPLAPIGTPILDTDAQTRIRLHTNKYIFSHGNQKICEMTEYKVVDNVQTSLGDARMDQQVKKHTIGHSFNSDELDDAMKLARFNTTHVKSIGDHATNEPIFSSSSILRKGKIVLSSSSPINSLLASEKIQFANHKQITDADQQVDGLATERLFLWRSITVC